MMTSGNSEILSAHIRREWMNTIQNCIKVETTENKYLYMKAKSGKENKPYQIVMITFNDQNIWSKINLEPAVIVHL